MEKDILKNHVCTCKEDNTEHIKKFPEGGDDDIFSCYKCEKPPKKLSREQRLRQWISYVFSKAKGCTDEEKLYKEAVEMFNKENK